MKLKDVEKRIKIILPAIDKEIYPETYDILTDIDSGNYEYENCMDVANVLHEADNDKELPQEIVSLLTDIYLDEGKEKNGDAYCDLGSLYYTGRCGVQDYNIAYKYYAKAAELGSRAAQENLGYCYYYGRMGEVDYKKAYHYFIKGALDNHLNSLYKIGDMYKNGYYVDKDEREAFLIYDQCYKMLNDENIQLVGADIFIRIADCLYNGIGTDKDLSTALHCYQQAESLYFQRLQHGDFMYKKQLERAMEMEQKVREELLKTLPGYEWTKKHS